MTLVRSLWRFLPRAFITGNEINSKEEGLSSASPRPPGSCLHVRPLGEYEMVRRGHWTTAHEAAGP